jgi:hypothetical protein
MSCFPRVLFVVRVAQSHLGIARPGTAAGDERFDEVGSRLGYDQTVSLLTGEARCLSAPGCNGYGRLGLRPVE